MHWNKLSYRWSFYIKESSLDSSSSSQLSNSSSSQSLIKLFLIIRFLFVSNDSIAHLFLVVKDEEKLKIIAKIFISDPFGLSCPL